MTPTGLRSPQARRASVLRGSIAAIAVVLFAAATFQLFGIRINLTPSLPLGLYIATGHRLATGEVAEFCPVGMQVEESVRYRGPGLCPDRAYPLLKPIVAVPGDTVSFAPNGIAVNGVSIPNTAPRASDGKGRPLRVWPPGLYAVDQAHVVVASSYHVGSYDSRYLGPIPVASIRQTLRPLWVIRGLDFTRVKQ